MFYCSYFWTNCKKTTFSKIRVAYNNVYRNILDVPKRGSASTMFVSNGIPKFEDLIRKSIFSFNSRLQTLCNSLICTIEQSWIVRNVSWKTWEDKLYTYYDYAFLTVNVVIIIDCNLYLIYLALGRALSFFIHCICYNMYDEQIA